MPLFEYNFEKNKTNLQRHGIDFKEAQKLWDNPYVIISAKNVLGEDRAAILGMIEKQIYLAIFTER